jgi:hypothetical protein
MTGPAVPENGLQAFGDWVLAALEQHADGAAEAARLMMAALRERDWDGDDVLADQFDALLGSGAMPDLRPLPVDLDVRRRARRARAWLADAGPSGGRTGRGCRPSPRTAAAPPR